MTVQQLIGFLSDPRFDPDDVIKIGVLEGYENELQTEPFGIMERFAGAGIVVLGGLGWAKVRMANREAEVEHTDPE